MDEQKYYRTSSHFYKVDGFGGVLHVNVLDNAINMIPLEGFEPIRENDKNLGALQEISKMDFIRAYDAVHEVIFKSRCR
jgi:hypothetical protein